MKLTTKQASLLAQEVRKRVLAQSSYKVSAKLSNEIKAFFTKLEVLRQKLEKAEQEYNHYENELEKITSDKVTYSYKNNNAEKVIAELEKNDAPTLYQIENDIILEQ